MFGHNGDKVGHPVLTVQDYVDHCLKLSTVVTSLELNIKQLLNDYNGKKKVGLNSIDGLQCELLCASLLLRY